MNFLLKIVEGTNVGAEIALVEGLCIKLGKAETCDVILADTTLPDLLCEIDTSSDHVSLLLPGGTQERLECFQVKRLGPVAFAIGPADEVWSELNWEPVANDKTPDVTIPQEVIKTSKPHPKWLKKSRILLLCSSILLLGIALFFLIPLSSSWGKGWEWGKRHVYLNKTTTESTALTPTRPTINDIVQKYHLTLEKTAKGTVLKGNFKTRSERLLVTAEAYEAQHDILLQFSDDISLLNTITETLFMLTEGKLIPISVENCNVKLKGNVASLQALQLVLQTLNREIPFITAIDCAEVTYGHTPTEDKALPIQHAITPYKPKPPTPLAFCGITTSPYPCMVLKDGSRIMEGAEFGHYIIDKITPEKIQIQGPEGPFIWTP